MPLPDGVALSGPGLVRRISFSWSWLGEKKAALPVVFELRQQRIGESARELQIGAAELRLQRFDQRIEHESVVVEVSIEMGLAVFMGGEQAAVAPHRLPHEVERPLRGLQPVWTIEYVSGAQHALGHQRIPAAQNLFVAAGPHALLACGPPA